MPSPFSPDADHPVSQQDGPVVLVGAYDHMPGHTDAVMPLEKALSRADFCVVIGWKAFPEHKEVINHVQQIRRRGGTIAAIGDVDDRYTSLIDFHLPDTSGDVISVFAIGPNSKILEDGAVRTYHPGFTVTAGEHSREMISSGMFPMPDNTIPMYSKSYVHLRPPLKPRPYMSKAELRTLSDDEIVELCKTSPSLTDTQLAHELRLAPVYLLASNILVKVGCAPHVRECEAKAQTLVRQRTTIPVPAVYRFFEHSGDSYLVMEYIPGDTLDTCWHDLSLWQRMRIACTLRNYVQQLRRISTPQLAQQVPGPITDDPAQPLPCFVPALGEYPVGAFATQRELRNWANGRFRVAQYVLRFRVDLPPFDDSAPLVFTHGDLCLRNLVLGQDGRLWLIDFGSAGVYPPWFEAYGARGFAGVTQPRLWLAARRIAVGEYDVQEQFAETCQHAFSYGLGIPDPGEGWDIETWDAVNVLRAGG